METSPVFYDSKGNRRRVLGRLGGILGVLMTVVIAIFAVNLMSAIPLFGTSDSLAHKGGKSSKDRKINGADYRKTRKALFAEIAAEKRPARPLARRKGDVVAAFYASWQEAGTNSLRAYGTNLTHVIPSWLHLNDTGDGLDFSDYDLELNPRNNDVIETARKDGVRIMPMLTNAITGPFDPVRVHKLFSDPAKQKTLARKVREWLVENKYQGLNLDFENLPDADDAKTPQFLQVLAEEFKPYNLELTLDVESSTDPADVAAAAKYCDWVMLMAYDNHAEGTGPGPIAPLEWTANVVDKLLKSVPANKVVMGVGSYAYDWQADKDAQSMTYQDALATASEYRTDVTPEKAIDFDAESLNATYDYKDDDGNDHEVWMLDAASAYNQWLVSQNHDLRGVGVWALGMEDPGIWSFFNRHLTDGEIPSVSALDSIEFPYGVDHTGKGEILRVLKHPTIGTRTVTVDDKDGLITDESYKRYPFPYVISHSGYIPKELALTFDDGPDPKYTPQVLDELKRLGVPATFFVMGRNVEGYPDLVRRIYDEGNEIGSHTFTHPDLGQVSTKRAVLELNATQRAIQSVTGHSTLLFRPPFNADSEPQAPGDVEPVNIADGMGYTTVGEKVDPQDWDLEYHLPNGDSRPKTAQDIVSSVLNQIHTDARKGEEGNVILLHDAGGPRDATIAALPTIVETLQKEGYKFVTISTLLKKDRAAVMPAVPASERMAIWFDGLVMGLAFNADSLLAKGFLVAIGLGLLRYLFVIPPALIHRWKSNRRTYDPAYRPTVTALIAAYNEEKVIARTIRSALASDYPIAGVVVVDDGSKDQTYDVVYAEFADDPRVKVVRQENAGKSGALNHALTLTDSEVVVCIDADTILDPQAIGLLVRHFATPRIGAVAGNIRVGNARNVLTQWQALEYTTSQNLDRQAYAELNSITVVPGALGAWRRSALLEVGGFRNDTLAEDMDLTWRIRQAEYRLETEPNALAFTEAPESFKGFFKQRFRWAYGTLQCLVKHRRALGKYGWFGAVALPTLWMFQVVFQALAPLIDLQVVYSLTSWLFSLNANSESAHAQASGTYGALIQVLSLYAIFLGVEFVGGWIAYRLEKQSAKPLAWIFLQRFAYRQVMYGVVYRSLLRALSGGHVGWGKLERKGTVKAASPRR